VINHPVFMLSSQPQEMDEITAAVDQIIAASNK